MYLRNYNTNPTLCYVQCYIQMQPKVYKFKDKTQKKKNPSWRRETFTIYISFKILECSMWSSHSKPCKLKTAK